MTNNISICPKCGRPANIIDGVFELSQYAVTVLDAPDKTYQTLAELKILLEESLARNDLPSTVRDKARAINPSFANLFDQNTIHEIGIRLVLITLLIYVILILSKLEAGDALKLILINIESVNVANTMAVGDNAKLAGQPPEPAATTGTKERSAVPPATKKPKLRKANQPKEQHKP